MMRAIPSVFAALIGVLLVPQPYPFSVHHSTNTLFTLKGPNMFALKSNAFAGGSDIPSRFTCDGENISPEMTWTGAPPGTKSFALIVHDPDAPRPGGFTHWVLFNIPSNAENIAENTPREPTLPNGAIQGKNDGGNIGYTGPCPPSGTHRYNFYLYALSEALDLKPGSTRAALEKAMQGHVLAKTELMGRYSGKSGKAA